MVQYYRYVIQWCVAGLNPNVWGAEMSWIDSKYLQPDEVELEAESRIVEQEGPWTNVDILSIEVQRVEVTTMHFIIKHKQGNLPCSSPAVTNN